MLSLLEIYKRQQVIKNGYLCATSSVMPHAPPDNERTFRQDNISSFSVGNIPV